MLYPGILPLVSMLDAFFKDGSNATKKLRLFYIAFLVIFIWELFPEWIFPLLTGFSIFCLANPNSINFTYVFGGTNGNEGLGILSLCFDWQYISGGVIISNLLSKIQLLTSPLIRQTRSFAIITYFRRFNHSTPLDSPYLCKPKSRT